VKKKRDLDKFCFKKQTSIITVVSFAIKLFHLLQRKKQIIEQQQKKKINK
jgi:hypothetical protein